MSWDDAGGPARGWAGPERQARPGPPMFDMMGRGPARPIKNLNFVGRGLARPVKFSEDGPRPGPDHQIFRGWAAVGPSPSHLKKFTAWPGPAHHFFKRLCPAGQDLSHGSEAHETRDPYGPARQLRGPAHVLFRTKTCMYTCLLYTSPSPRDGLLSRMPSSA